MPLLTPAADPDGLADHGHPDSFPDPGGGPGTQADDPVGCAAPDGSGGQAGQATAEYALVLLGAAAVALLLVGWATHSNAIGHLLDAVVAQLERKLS